MVSDLFLYCATVQAKNKTSYALFRTTCDETKGVTQTRKPGRVTCRRKPILTNPAQFLVQILA